MTQYINPPQSVAKGRRLSGSSYGELKRALMPGEVLAGLFDRIIFKVAPVIETAQDFDDFYSQYSRGQFISADFYAVTEEASNEQP